LSKPESNIKVLVGMSGGVDSSVAAALLKEKGCRISGVTMQIWEGETGQVETKPPACCGPGEGEDIEDTREAARRVETKHHACYGPGEAEDIDDAREVARILGIPFHVIDLRSEYRTEVLDYYCGQYLSGRTPNPCFRCNRSVKFGALLSKSRESGIEFDYFATGHYARVDFDSTKNRYLLKKARDLDKDQSYFLASLTQEQLANVLFPLGDYTKPEIRQIASKFGLPVKDKPESQDFIAGGYRSLIKTEPAGPIMDRLGNTLGEHGGISSYTIGQRRGLGISSKEPLYVVDIDSGRNAVIVGPREELYHDEMVASDMNWIAVEQLEQPVDAKARIRYRHKEADAKLVPLGESGVYVKFIQPQLSITPGQVVVFYQGDIVLGGGIIDRVK
jgi:tRNA-uridine 2-sulfurtransferase